MRTLYTLGFAYIAVCGLSLITPWLQPPAPVETVGAVAVLPDTPGGWFAQIKSSCNPVEVKVALLRNPAPSNLEGQGYRATCYALAGKIDLAKQVIDTLPEGQRATAASIIFNVGHPIADAGDDNSAAPLMALVIDYWPENYMALYHAGIAEYNLNKYDTARLHLTAFLNIYTSEDGWRANAQKAMAGIESGTYPVLPHLAE